MSLNILREVRTVFAASTGLISVHMERFPLTAVYSR